MNQYPAEWSSPPPASSRARSFALIGAASLVMILGSLGGFYAATSPSPSGSAEAAYRSVPLVPTPIERAPAGDPVAVRRPTQLEPTAPPNVAAPPAEPPSPPGAEAAAAPAAEPPAPPAVAAPSEPAPPAVAAPATSAGPAPATSAGPAAAPAEVAAAPGGATASAGARLHPLLENEPLPDARATELGTRRAIELRMQSGQATAHELRLLKAICQHQGDAVCKARAQEALKKLSE